MLLHMKRTTLKIDDALLRALKRKAADEGQTLQATTNDLLRRALATPPRRRYELRLHGWKAAELPGVNLLDRDALFDLMNGR
jgi:plasmid stability protein